MSKIQTYIDNFFESEKYRLPNFFPVGTGIGIVMYFSLDNEPSFIANISTFVGVLIACIFTKSYKMIVPLMICLGFFIAQLRTKTIDTFMLTENDKKFTSLTAVVESCEKTEKGLTFTVGSIETKKHKNLNKLQLTWRGKKALASPEDYPPGTKVLFKVILSPVASQAFPNAYDFKKQLYFRGISARGFITKPPKILAPAEQTSLDMHVNRLRHGIDKKIEESLPGSTAAIAKALITGNKAGISKEIRAHFSNSGTAHLLAISGLHMGIIGFFTFWLFRIFLCCIPRISMFCNVKKIAAILSWPVVLFYLYISGKSVSSVRAFIMHSIIIVAVLLDRSSITMRSVAIAATMIMLFSPEAIMFPSFQMSFGAVIAIVAFYEKVRNFSRHFLLNTTATTLIASIPTSLFSIYTFNQLTLNSVLANTASIPLMSFLVMPLAVISLFFMAFNLLHPFTDMMGQGVNLLMKISELASKLPGSYFVMPTPSDLNMAIFIFSGLILALIHHRIRIAGIFGLIIGVAFYYLNPTDDIFISPKAKAVGIRTKDAVCFNHLGYFRSATSAWAKSVGFEKKDKFNSKACRGCISKIDEDTYKINHPKGCIIITKDEEFSSDIYPIILLDEDNEFAETVSLPSLVRKSNNLKKRPWS